jgi:two-component system, LytTR family, sensor kinase
MLTQTQIAALLIKVAVATSIASILMRFARMQAILLQDERTVADRLQLAFIFSLLFGAGAEIRILSHNTYPALDLALEGSVVAGMLGGYVSGLITGICVAVPDMFAGEYMSMPLYAASGLIGALMHDLAPEKEDVWYFSPFVDLNLYRLLRQILRLNRNAIQRRVVERAAFNVTCNALVIVTELLRWGIYKLGFTRHGTFFLFAGREPLTPAVLGASAATTLFAVSLPIRVWSSFRAERQLEMQRALLVEARLAALTNQINPHFLFNTLNSLATLIRIEPDRARSMVYKLSSIMRRLLKKAENFSPLREEISFIDDYLAIEMIRFGSKLRFSKEIEEAALDRLIPSMILQPIIENSIKHGLARKLEGGTIKLKAWVEDTQLHISIEDDGVGMPESELGSVLERGVGVSNVNERLRVLFGSTYRLVIDSQEGKGTETLITIPELENYYAPDLDVTGKRGAVGTPSA